MWKHCPTRKRREQDKDKVLFQRLSVPNICRERRCLQRCPEQLMATKDKKKDERSEFLFPGGSGVSREVG